jgi:hypothetical protein
LGGLYFDRRPELKERAATFDKPKELGQGSFIPGRLGRDRIALMRLQQTMAGHEPQVSVVFKSRSKAGGKEMRPATAARQGASAPMIWRGNLTTGSFPLAFK